MPLGITRNELRTIGELATLNRWHLNFDRGPIAAPPPLNVNLLCQSTSLPQVDEGEQMTVNIRQFDILRPGIYKPSHSIELTFIDVEDNYITAWITDWREAIFDTVTGQQFADINNITCDISLTRLNRQDNPIWRYKLFGCYRQGGEPGGQLGVETEALQPTLTLYYDYFSEGAV